MRRQLVIRRLEKEKETPETSLGGVANGVRFSVGFSE
ncbi:hypothetical protein PSAB6_570139 [Paraburkholderia sabiae]|nr:hypothetical protein PSAB6_570139 [Paraburkholderia sabiae]